MTQPPAYWHGPKEIKLNTGGGKTLADVVFAFGGKGSAQVSIDEVSRTLELDYIRGPFRGTQTARVKDRAVEAEWFSPERTSYSAQ